MESNGTKNRIHISETVANLLIEAGKEVWLRPRAKGKGEMTTLWLEPKGAGQQSSSGCSSSSSSSNTQPAQNFECKQPGNVCSLVDNPGGEHGTAFLLSSVKTRRLVQWNADSLACLLKSVIVHRVATAGDEPSDVPVSRSWSTIELTTAHKGKEQFPTKLSRQSRYQGMTQRSWLRSGVYCALRSCFGWSSSKATSRRLQPCIQKTLFITSNTPVALPTLSSSYLSVLWPRKQPKAHDFRVTTRTASRRIQFCVVLAALVHDVDHPGVPNTTLVKEHSNLAKVYRNKSVAEQNSVESAWDLLMDENFVDLRRALYGSQGSVQTVEKLALHREGARKTKLREMPHPLALLKKEKKMDRTKRMEKGGENTWSVSPWPDL